MELADATQFACGSNRRLKPCLGVYKRMKYNEFNEWKIME
jgi:hypothetical protein